MHLQLFYYFAASKFGYQYFIFFEYFDPVSDLSRFIIVDLLYTALR